MNYHETRICWMVVHWLDIGRVVSSNLSKSKII